MIYRHVQTSPMVWVVAAGVLVIDAMVIAVLVATGAEDAGMAIVLAVAPTLVAIPLTWAVSRLVVEVDRHQVRVRFGVRWPRRRIDLAEIESVSATRNSWWLGWGIRKVPKGWMFNVWGLDAVELRLRSGRRFRIGTDEPAKLVAAIEASRR